MKLVIKVDMSKLKALLISTPKKELRFYLCGIFFDTENGALVSTDGRRLLAVHAVFEPGIRPFIAPRALIEQALKLATKRDPQLLVHIAENEGVRSLTISGASGTVGNNEIDGTFPQWRRAVPRESSGEFATFDPHYMADMADAFSLLAGEEKLPEFYYNGNGSVLVAAKGLQAIGVVVSVPGHRDVDRTEWKNAALSVLNLAQEVKS